jgi:hypothetical protein
LNAQNHWGLLFLLLFLVVWLIYGPKCFNRRFSTFLKERYNSANSLQAPKHTHAFVCLYHSTHTHAHARC